MRPPATWPELLSALADRTRSPSAGTAAEALAGAPERPDVFLVPGVHGSILFDDVGYCEFDDADRAWECLRAWAGRRGLPVAFEVSLCSLEALGRRRPVWELLRGAEVPNPLWSQPYLRHVGEASNLLQLELGVRALEEHGLAPRVFASSEHALHPQLPQLLRGFGIESAFATARLGGAGPACAQPGVEWIGLDGTSVPAIVAQSGLPSGQTWHGAFATELPALLFAAASRPDLAHVVYANVEDFANPMPLADELAAHVGELEQARVRVRPFAGLAGGEIPLARSARFTIEDFPVRRMRSRLVAAVRRTEELLVLVEGAYALLGPPAPEEAAGVEARLDGAWRRLLLAQNHDGYVVPEVRPGLYSMQQGLVPAGPVEGPTIEEHGLGLAEQARGVAAEVLARVTGVPGDASESPAALLNVLGAREVVLAGRRWRLPALGTGTCSEPFEPRVRLAARDDEVVALEGALPRCRLPGRPETVLREAGALRLAGAGWRAFVREAGARAELRLEAECELELAFEMRGAPHVSYPFGSEPTSEREGHSLRFLWEPGGFVVAHSGTPYFRRADGFVLLQIPPGTHDFAIAPARTVAEAWSRAWDFFQPPLAVARARPAVAGVSLPEGAVPVLARRRAGVVRRTFLSIDGAQPRIPGARCVDLRGRACAPAAGPWRILTLEHDAGDA